MSSKRLSLRFNLNNPGDLAAWEYLHRLDGDSINKEIISMINASKQNNDLRELLRQTITVAMQGMALQPVAKKEEIKRQDISKADALKMFGDRGEVYKTELISELEDGTITTYTQGSFTDLCRGPHLQNTSYLKAVKIFIQFAGSNIFFLKHNLQKLHKCATLLLQKFIHFPF